MLCVLTTMAATALVVQRAPPARMQLRFGDDSEWRRLGLGGPLPAGVSYPPEEPRARNVSPLSMESMAPAMGAVVGVSLCALAGYAISTATAPDTVPSELAQNACAHPGLCAIPCACTLWPSNRARNRARGWLVLPLSLFYLTMSGAMKAEEAVDWACVITGDAEEVCGAGDAPRHIHHLDRIRVPTCIISAARRLISSPHAPRAQHRSTRAPTWSVLRTTRAASSAGSAPRRAIVQRRF